MEGLWAINKVENVIPLKDCVDSPKTQTKAILELSGCRKGIKTDYTSLFRDLK